MTWTAWTGFAEIGFGTTMLIVGRYVTGQQELPYPAAGEALTIRHNNQITNTKVVASSPSELVLEIDGGQLAFLTPHTERDFPLGIDDPSPGSTGWVVRKVEAR